jgi:hypothetical protein
MPSVIHWFLGRNSQDLAEKQFGKHSGPSANDPGEKTLLRRHNETSAE